MACFVGYKQHRLEVGDNRWYHGDACGPIFMVCFRHVDDKGTCFNRYDIHLFASHRFALDDQRNTGKKEKDCRII